MAELTTFAELLWEPRPGLPRFVRWSAGAQAGDGNGGLLFERIGARWGTKGNGPDKGRPEARKGEWAEAITRRHGDGAALNSYAERLKRLARVHGGTVQPFKTDWRLVTGMGIPNPMENGLTWHRTLGVPYLPGSGVKGLIRAFAREWAEDKPAGEEERRIFGRGPEKEEPQEIKETAGSLVFFDAVPMAPVEVLADVMTPHQSRYYAGEEGPSDSVPPIPIVFVAVGEATLQFAIAPAFRYTNLPPTGGGPDGLDVAQGDCARAFAWLELALQIMGAGAKTKANYGRMSPVPTS
jgi:CRISPR-associated protein Cmr6